MKKIMHILNSTSYSGAEKVVITIIKNLPEEYEACYVSPFGSIAKQLQQNCITYYPVDRLSKPNLLAVIKEFKPDIIHAHDCRASVYACLIPYHVPIISHLHNNDPRARHWNMYSFLYLLASYRVKNVLLVSNSILKEAVFSKRIEKKSQVIGNPIQVFPTVEDEIKKSYDLAFIGRFVEQKDPIRFIYLVNELKKRFPSISAVMIGDGELFAACKKMILDLQLTDTITLTGFLEKPISYLRKVKIVLMPSKWEGFGLAATEALSCGVPVLAKNVGGLSTIINDSCGKLCESDADFINEVTSLLTNVDYYKEKQIQAFIRADELNNLESYMETICSIYKQL